MPTLTGLGAHNLPSLPGAVIGGGLLIGEVRVAFEANQSLLEERGARFGTATVRASLLRALTSALSS